MYCRNELPIFFPFVFHNRLLNSTFPSQNFPQQFYNFFTTIMRFLFHAFIWRFFFIFLRKFFIHKLRGFFISRRNLTTFFYFPRQLDNFFQKLFISCFHFTSFFFTELQSSWGGQSQEVFYAKKLFKKKFLQCKKKFLQLFQQPRRPRPQIKMIHQQEHWARRPYPNERNRLNPISILSHQQYQVKQKRFKKIAWIGSHHLQLQWKFKLWIGKFAWCVIAKHCWALSTNFLFSKVCWHHPAMFCLITSSKLSRQ